MVAELEGGSSSVVEVEIVVGVVEIIVSSPAASSTSEGTMRAKIRAKSEAKHRKRSIFIMPPSLPQKPLDIQNPHI